MGRIHSKRRGFTVVELVIVIAILGLISAYAMSRFISLDQEVITSLLQQNLGIMRSAIHIARSKSYASTGTYSYPTDLTAELVGNKVPEHPENDFGVAALETVTNADTNPANKVLKNGVNGAYWYNTENGEVRARVADQGTSQSTLNFYNLINGTSATSLGNYGGGGGGGGIS